MTNELRSIFKRIADRGGNALIVGGHVRDSHLGIESKDIDVEVYGLPSDRLAAVLRSFGKVDIVGLSFGVIKLTTESQDYDFSLPRKDNKVGVGHKDFTVEVDHTMTPKEAAKRRDFTINSVAADINGVVLDPYCGIRDLSLGILRATSEHYQEDALRVLRGMQFCGRFCLTADNATVNMSRKMFNEGISISPERVREEWMKWALKSTSPSYGLGFLSDSHWTRMYPEIHALEGLMQDEEWHPEGTVFTHTALVCDAAARIAVRDNLNEWDRTVLMFAALCHDMGKATTTSVIDGRIRSPGHAEAGEEPTRQFMKAIGCAPDSDLTNEIVSLVRCHMAHIGVNVTDRFVRRLSNRVHPSNIKQLARLIEADHSGRYPLPGGMPESAKEILVVAAALEVENAKPKPIVMGRHLIQIGLKPGPHFGPLLDAAYQGQLDGEFQSVQYGLEYLAEMS